MIPYGRQDISQDDIDHVVQVLRSDFLTQGPMVPQFEAAVASYCGATHAVAVCNATAALHIACLALGVSHGDRVWTTPITFVASANCAVYCGASIDFVDIDPSTCNMSVASLAEKLARAKAVGALPKVVIPVHLCGQSCDMKAIHALSQEFGFSIVEDASHAIGGRYLGMPVGGCQYSDITIFSFHPVKIITTGEGGMAVTNNPELARLMQQYRSHGITSNPDEMLIPETGEVWNYQQIRLGYNYRLTDIQAALGLSQMTRLNEFVQTRRNIATEYDRALACTPFAKLEQLEDTCSSYHLYPIRIDPQRCGKNQRQVYNFLLKQGIRVNLHYIPVYRQPFFEAMGFSVGYCPEAERYYREAISLPIYSSLKPEQQQYVIEVLREALSV